MLHGIAEIKRKESFGTILFHPGMRAACIGFAAGIIDTGGLPGPLQKAVAAVAMTGNTQVHHADRSGFHKKILVRKFKE